MVVTDEGELIAGRYRLVSQVGAGAMGVVWQAQDELLHRTVAVKQLVLRVGMGEGEASEASRRAMREGRITARLHHPNAITVYDVVEYKGAPCLVMEYLRSESLASVLERQGTLPAERVAAIGRQVAAALVAAHEAGIVHRDIKPGNVLLTEDGTVKITDFGISRAIGDGTVTATGVLAGTPAYLAPEIAQGADAAFPSDVFSLGSTLYAAVEGAPPFGLDDNAMALLYRIASYEIRPPAQAGPLAPVLTQLLAKDPAERPTMPQAREALAAVAGAQPAATAAAPSAAPATTASRAGAAAAPPADPSTQRGRGPGRGARRGLGVAAVALVLVAAGVVAALLTHRTAGQPGTAQPAPPSVSQAPPPANGPTTTTTTTPPAQATTTTVAAPPPPPPQSQSDQVRNAILSYYALMPGNLSEGWNWMTADYQTNHAGGFSGYQQFWSQIQRVSVQNVQSTSPSTVDATVDYFYQDGRVVEEQTNYGMAFEGDRWKIASSTVSSSVTRSG
jgi:eukaryotic-like serine/threonine-protein kinase